MFLNSQDPIRGEEDGHLAQDTERPLRKRAASIALDIRVDKRPRREDLEVNDHLEQSVVGCEQECIRHISTLTEDDSLHRNFEREVDKMTKYKASTYDPKHASDPGYDQFYGLTSPHRQSTVVVEESKSYIICDSPQEALRYLKTHEKDIRRRIKHIIFSCKAVAFGPSLNGLHWKGFCNYIRKYMCIESIMIPVPYDPLSGHIRYNSSEDDDLMQEAIEDRKYSPTAYTKRCQIVFFAALRLLPNAPHPSGNKD